MSPTDHNTVPLQILALCSSVIAVSFKRFMQTGPGGEPVPHIDGAMYVLFGATAAVFAYLILCRMAEEMEKVTDTPLPSLAADAEGFG